MDRKREPLEDLPQLPLKRSKIEDQPLAYDDHAINLDSDSSPDITIDLAFDSDSDSEGSTPAASKPKEEKRVEDIFGAADLSSPSPRSSAPAALVKPMRARMGRILPPGWMKKTTRKGNVLYVNKNTGEVSTIFPGQEVEEDPTLPDIPAPTLAPTSVPPPQKEPGEVTGDQVRSLFSDTHRTDTKLEPSLSSELGLTKDDDAPGTKMTDEEALEYVKSQLNVSLYEHQETAVMWMRQRENHRDCNGGILADDMGCGKTLTTISLILSNPNPYHKRQHTLLVVPLSLMLQWKQEIDRRVKGHRWRILLHHGPDRTRDYKDFLKKDLVITTYGILAGSFKPSSEDDPGYRKALCRMDWYRVILDEAHTIKNRTTRVSRSAFSLYAKKRWCLSGTPIQNNLNELQTLFGFLRFAPYDEFAYWKQTIISQFFQFPDETMRRLRDIVQKIVLRRRKDHVIREKLELPERDIGLLKADFSAREQQNYQHIEALSQKRFNEIASNDQDVRSNYLHLLAILSRMRQACCHPLLTQYATEAVENEDGEVEDEERRKHLDNLKALQAKELILSDCCSICLLDPPNKGVVTPCEHKFCEDCLSTWRRMNTTCPSCLEPLPAEAILTPVEETTNLSDRIADELANERKSRPEGGSTKIRKLLEDLRIMMATTDDKCLVVSQWTRFLSLIQVALRARGIEFLQLDGTLRMAQRQEIIERFGNSSCRVLLLSMHAAGLGLNIIAANRVFMMGRKIAPSCVGRTGHETHWAGIDLWWNISVENQVIDRVHRIGQKKEVKVHRYAINGTIEERIIQLQEQKQLVSDCTLSDVEGPISQKLDYMAFAHLFGLARNERPTPAPEAEEM